MSVCSSASNAWPLYMQVVGQRLEDDIGCHETKTGGF